MASAPGRAPQPARSSDWHNGGMEQAITATLPLEELAALDRVCRHQGVSRHDAVESAVRWYIEREGDLPSVDDLDEIELP